MLEHVVHTGQFSGHAMTQPSTRRKPSRAWRWTVRIIAVLMILAGIYGTYRRSLSNKVEAKLAAIRAAGYLVTLAELDAWYAYPPPGQPNAADLYLQAAMLLNIPDDRDELPIIGRADLPPLAQPMPAEMRKAIDALLADNADVLAILHDAAAREYARYPINLRGGQNALLSHLGGLRVSVQLLSLQALDGAERNQQEEAIRSIEAACRVAESLSNEPVLMSQLVRLGMYGEVLTTTERVVNRTALADKELVSLMQMLGQMHWRESMTRGLAAERCVLTDLFQRPFSQSRRIAPTVSTNVQRFLPQALHLMRRLTGAHDGDHLAGLAITTAQIEASKLPITEVLAEAEAVDRDIDQLPGLGGWSRLLVIASARPLTIGIRTSSAANVARVALAVRRYQLHHGRLPEKLEDVAPTFIDAVPIDPFDGKPLRYKKLDEGFVVYSVGENGVDDGGVAAGARRRRFERDTDITFTVAR